jgi:hypothetical protein
MEQRTTTDPERELERSGDELEERLERLDGHIGEARQEARARHEEQDPFESAGADADDADDDEGSGGDPDGFDDPEADEEEED